MTSSKLVIKRSGPGRVTSVNVLLEDGTEVPLPPLTMVTLTWDADNAFLGRATLSIPGSQVEVEDL